MVSHRGPGGTGVWLDLFEEMLEDVGSGCIVRAVVEYV